MLPSLLPLVVLVVAVLLLLLLPLLLPCFCCGSLALARWFCWRRPLLAPSVAVLRLACTWLPPLLPLLPLLPACWRTRSWCLERLVDLLCWLWRRAGCRRYVDAVMSGEEPPYKYHPAPLLKWFADVAGQLRQAGARLLTEREVQRLPVKKLFDSYTPAPSQDNTRRYLE